MWTWILVTGWLLCAIGSAGLTFAYFHMKYPYSRGEWRQDLGMAICLGLYAGPVALVLAFFFSGFGQYGWRLRPVAQT